MTFDMTNELLQGLPAYEGGIMAPNLYDAGGGFYDDRPKPQVGDSIFPRRFFGPEPKPIPREFFDMFVQRSAVGGDKVTVTETENGVKAVVERKIGDVSIEWHDDQTMDMIYTKVNDFETYPDKKTWMRTVTETNSEAFETYIGRLCDIGFEKVYENRIEDNIYCQLQQNDRLIYAYFMANTGIARFIDDVASMKVTDFGYSYAKKSEDFAAVIQYALYHSPDSRVDGVRSDCGMFYIIKLADNSVVYIDGAAMEECTDAATAEVMRLTRELTGVPEGEKVRVAAWFCTHAHGDHIEMFSKLVRFYHDQLDIERLFYNFTSPDIFAAMGPGYKLMDRLNAHYSDIKYLKCHSGQSFELGGVKFDVLQTHEDGTGAEGNEVIGGFNDTSTILQISFDGLKFMVLGDMDNSAEAIMVKNYSPATLKSDLVQTAHHLMNNLELMYPAISPEIALVPQHPVFKVDHNKYKYETLCRSVKEENIYFDTLGTVGFRAKDGKPEKFLHNPMVGGEYDGSDV